MILYYFPLDRNTVSKTVSENFTEMYMCTYFTIYSIYWSDTSLTNMHLHLKLQVGYVSIYIALCLTDSQ